MTYHALLIGIDHYLTPDVKPLRGCVNDVDAVQAVLLDVVGLSPHDIVRLDSPLPGSTHDTRVPRRDATLANIRAALEDLATPRVTDGDRVFIFYSGHGNFRSVQIGERAVQIESLMPMDPAVPGGFELLTDAQINRRLEDIAARTASVSVVLDCCFGSGATRGAGRARCAVLPRGARIEHGIVDDAPLARGIANCHVVTACLAYETSREKDDPQGAYGVFTRAFTQAVRGAAGDPRTLTWAEIWQPLCATVEQHNRDQHAWMEGSAARAVFGGPPVDRDPGFAVHRDGDVYRVAAGSLVDVTQDAVLAVYGPAPSHFPRLGSIADQRARVGELVVSHAERGHATARPQGALFDLPADARARLIRAGAAAGLRYDVEPADPAMLADLARSPLLERAPDAAVRLVHHADRWFVTDDVHGTGHDGDGRPVLFALPDASAARRALEHYASYARPVALARRLAGAGETSTGGLTIRLLPHQRDLRDRSAGQRAGLTATALLPTTPDAYDLREGAELAVAIDNTTQYPLRVALFDVAPSGKVYLLGEHAIRAGQHVTFWRDGSLDRPFSMIAPDGARDAWIERVIAIGRNEQGSDLRYLQVPTSFADAVHAAHEPTAPPGPGRAGATEHWTSAQAVLTIRS